MDVRGRPQNIPRSQSAPPGTENRPPEGIGQPSDSYGRLFQTEFLLFNAFNRDAKRDFVRDSWQECFHFEIASLQRARCFPPRTKLAFRARTAADGLNIQNQRFGNTTEGKITGYFVGFIVDFLNRCALEGRSGELRSIEEIWAYNVFITVGGVVCQPAVLILSVNCILGWIGLIECECPAKGVKRAIHVA